MTNTSTGKALKTIIIWIYLQASYQSLLIKLFVVLFIYLLLHVFVCFFLSGCELALLLIWCDLDPGKKQDPNKLKLKEEIDNSYIYLSVDECTMLSYVSVYISEFRKG